MTPRRDIVERAVAKRIFARVARRSVSAPPELADTVDPQYLLRALIYRGVTSIVAGSEWRPIIALARTIAAQCV